MIGSSSAPRWGKLGILLQYCYCSLSITFLQKAENKREAEDRLNGLLPKLEILDKVTLDSVLTEFETKVANF